MRIIAGEAGGIPLQVPKALTRPTTDRVREAIFSSLGNRVPGARVLDLYAGSGALGIEALSRGAKSAVFVDTSRQACETIEKNLAKARLDGGTVRCQRVLAFLRGFGRTGTFDIVFADPPYARDAVLADELAALLVSESLPATLNEEGVFVLESLAETDLPLSPNWSVERERDYGGTRIRTLSKEGRIGDPTRLNRRSPEDA